MVIEQFYKYLSDGKNFKDLYIPRSEVVYIKAAVKARYNYEATYQEIEEAILDLYEEGALEVPKGLLKDIKRDKTRRFS